jgi:hypothetical protein
MEPENNLEMIINGYLMSKREFRWCWLAKPTTSLADTSNKNIPTIPFCLQAASMMLPLSTICGISALSTFMDIP